MAQTWDKFRDACRLVERIAGLVDEIRDAGRLLLDVHDGEPFTGAGDTPTPGYVLTDVSGNVKGTHFTPAEYLGGVSFVREFEKFMTNQTPGTGWWNGIVAHLMPPQAGG